MKISACKQLLAKLIFYMCNRSAYKMLAFGSLLVRPLRVEGKQFITLNTNVRVGDFVWLMAYKYMETDPQIVFGDHCAVGPFAHIFASGDMQFGQNVKIGHRVFIADITHDFEDINMPIIQQKLKFLGQVRIGDGTVIGDNACVMGSRIGKNCIIGENSVLMNADIPDHSVVEGNPYRITRRFDPVLRVWEKL